MKTPPTRIVGVGHVAKKTRLMIVRPQRMWRRKLQSNGPIYAIIYGGLGALRGDNQAHSLLRRDSAVTIAVLIPVAWHIGGLAGYW